MKLIDCITLVLLSLLFVSVASADETYTTIEASKARFPGMPDWWYEMNVNAETRKAVWNAEHRIYERGATKLNTYQPSGANADNEASAARAFYEKQTREWNSAVEADREARRIPFNQDSQSIQQKAELLKAEFIERYKSLFGDDFWHQDNVVIRVGGSSYLGIIVGRAKNRFEGKRVYSVQTCVGMQRERKIFSAVVSSDIRYTTALELYTPDDVEFDNPRW